MSRPGPMTVKTHDSSFENLEHESKQKQQTWAHIHSLFLSLTRPRSEMLLSTALQILKMRGNYLTISATLNNEYKKKNTTHTSYIYARGSVFTHLLFFIA
eukprot:sb/3478740/